MPSNLLFASNSIDHYIFNDVQSCLFDWIVLCIDWIHTRRRYEMYDGEIDSVVSQLKWVREWMMEVILKDSSTDMIHKWKEKKRRKKGRDKLKDKIWESIPLFPQVHCKLIAVWFAIAPLVKHYGQSLAASTQNEGSLFLQTCNFANNICAWSHFGEFTCTVNDYSIHIA